jgi:outer membrane lipoprotein-sorting protein
MNSESTFAQIIERLTLSFEREIDRDSQSENIRGILYLESNGKIQLRIQEPVTQWMVIEEKLMTIYYPLENRAFQIYRKDPFLLPFYHSFFSLDKDEIDLSRFGFKLSKKEKKNDTLFVFWQQIDKEEESNDIIIMALANDKTAFISIKDQKGNTKATTYYNNYYEYRNNYFPLEIISHQYSNNTQVIERITYSHPQINVSLPPDVVDFKIPPNTDIKVIKW